MFTGIIEEIGAVTAIEPSGDGVRLSVRAPLAISDASHGDSISVNGVCLTVVDSDDSSFTADVMRQTLDMSTLAALAQGRPVNIERATAVGTRLGGHVVQGHVDGTGVILEVRPGERWRVVRVGLPAALAPLVVDKGSIAIDGVSLTVNAIEDTPSGVNLMLNIIPHTAAVTTFGALHPGQAVNLEIDVLARYLQRMEALRGKA